MVATPIARMHAFKVKNNVIVNIMTKQDTK